jgi:hypothetical protein
LLPINPQPPVTKRRIVRLVSWLDDLSTLNTDPL